MIDENRLEFGKGDIGIHMGDTSDIAMLVFRNLKQPAPIGRWLNGGKVREMELQTTDVVMSFSNTESIDALMKCLKVVRRKLSAAVSQNDKQEAIYE